MPDYWMDVDTALSEVLINKIQLIDDTDFKTREESVVYNQAGLDLVWEFVTTGGVYTQTAVTPTDTAGDYDWVNQANGFYTIEIPASGGASINNDSEGFGRFVGFATGILPWIGPTIGFRAAGLNNSLIDSAYSSTRGLAGTALPDAVFDAAGGLPVSDAGGLDLDTKLANTNEITVARMGALTDWINGGRLDLILDIIAVDTTTDIPALIATAQADLDKITGADGVTLATLQALYAPNKVVPASLSEFNARSLVAAAYTVVSDLGTVQTADHTAAIADIPTNAEFNARSIPSADYVVVGDTIAGVTLVTTVTTNTDLVSAADVKAAMEANNSDLDYLVTDLVNKKSILIADGVSTQYNDAGGSLGAVGAGYSDDGTTVLRPRQVIAK